VSSRVLWWVIVDRAAEERWRAALGQADIEAWCAAHGWDARDVRSNSVMVSALKATDYAPSRVEVMAELIERDEHGKPFLRGGNIATRMVWANYCCPLPEGIALVSRP